MELGAYCAEGRAAGEAKGGGGEAVELGEVLIVSILIDF